MIASDWQEYRAGGRCLTRTAPRSFGRGATLKGCVRSFPPEHTPFRGGSVGLQAGTATAIGWQIRAGLKHGRWG